MSFKFQDQNQNKASFPFSSRRRIKSSFECQERGLSQRYYKPSDLDTNPSIYSTYKTKKSVCLQDFQSKPQPKKQNFKVQNIKTQLQSIKFQVQKLINKGHAVSTTDNNTKISHERDFTNDFNYNYSSIPMSNNMRQFIPIQTIQKGSQIQFQNQILKKELTALKSRHIIKKKQFNEQRQILKNKIKFLQDALSHQEQYMRESKMGMPQSFSNLKNMKSNNHSIHILQHEQSKIYIKSLQKQLQDLSEKIVHLKKRIQKTELQIKMMEIKNNSLIIEIQETKKHTNNSKMQTINRQLVHKIQQKQLIISELSLQVQDMKSKQWIANEVVTKNTELIQKLATERQKYTQLQKFYKSKLDLCHKKRQYFQKLSQKYQCIDDQFQKLQLQYDSVSNQNQFLRDIISEFQKNNKSQNITEKNTILQYQLEIEQKNRLLQDQMGQLKRHISQMIVQTAVKINCLQKENLKLKEDMYNISQQQYLQQRQQPLNLPQRNQKNIQEMQRNVVQLKRNIEVVIQQSQSIVEIFDNKTQQLQINQTGVNKQAQYQMEFKQKSNINQRAINGLQIDGKDYKQLYEAKCKQLEHLELKYKKYIDQNSCNQQPLDQRLLTIEKQQTNHLQTNGLIQQFQMQRSKWTQQKQKLKIQYKNRTTKLQNFLDISQKNVELLQKRVETLIEQNQRMEQIIIMYIKSNRMLEEHEIQKLVSNYRQIANSQKLNSYQIHYTQKI